MKIKSEDPSNCIFQNCEWLSVVLSPKQRWALHVWESHGNVKCSAVRCSCGKVIRKGRNSRKSSRIILSMSTNSWTLDLCKVLFLGLVMSSVVATQLCPLEPGQISQKGHAVIEKLPWSCSFASWLADTKFGLDYYIFLWVSRHLLLGIIICTFHADWKVL